MQLHVCAKGNVTIYVYAGLCVRPQHMHVVKHVIVGSLHCVLEFAWTAEREMEKLVISVCDAVMFLTCAAGP
jgi:hypothetical protein